MDYWERNGIEKPQQVVVCAACKYGDLVLCGPRHWGSSMMSQYRALKQLGFDVGTAAFDQGFINQFGEFLTRQEAMVIAQAAGQPVDIERGCGGDAETLYSEGLY